MKIKRKTKTQIKMKMKINMKIKINIPIKRTIKIKIKIRKKIMPNNITITNLQQNSFVRCSSLACSTAATHTNIN